MSNPNDDPITELIEMFGLRFQDQRMPRIAGRLFGLLIVEGGPLSFAELSERLQVSRGSVSTNARLLADIGLIERVGMPGDRHDHYRMAPGGLGAIFRKQLARMNWADEFYRSVEARLPEDRKDTKRRLFEIATFTRKAAEGLERGLLEAEAELKSKETI